MNRHAMWSAREPGAVLRLGLTITVLAWCASATAGLRRGREVTFTIVYDNTSLDRDLEGDWGFACLVTGTERSVLFDAGTRPDVFWANLEKLDRRPDEIDLVVLSHEHRDHAGGLWSLLERRPGVTVVAPGSFSEDFFERIKATGARDWRIEAPTALGDGLWVTGPVGGGIVEQSLVVEAAEGLVVVTGCSHPGVVEIVRRVREVLGRPIHLVFGGFHLLRASSDEVRGVVRELKDLGVERVGPAHCTGGDAIRLFREGFGSRFVETGAGRVLRLTSPTAGPPVP